MLDINNLPNGTLCKINESTTFSRYIGELVEIKYIMEFDSNKTMYKVSFCNNINVMPPEDIYYSYELDIIEEYSNVINF